ncbi:MAG TPA: flagellar type III secretion system protein FlhB [Beijerinckiaceae bacterium]|nr:flagellar type III secretion system protein FlhB [Beijerinckiaceae bacterium]
MAEGQEQEDKTEEPSERRLEKAFERGEVPRSADLSAFVSVLSAGATAFATAAFVAGPVRDDLAAILANAAGASVVSAGAAGLRSAAMATAGPLLAGMAGAVCAGLAMHRIVLTSEPLMPKLERISPAAGWKRLVGAENVVQFGKTALKVLVIIAVLAALWRADGWRLGATGLLTDVNGLAEAMRALSGRVFWSVLAVFAVFAVLDAAYQRFAWRKRLRMSHQEVKEEHKESEGSPEIKQRVRNLQRQRARQRMMAAVPKASVIIANPTHFAVALRYEKGMAAPVCLAKGVDDLALRIRALAAEHRIPVVENPPLARALHATVKIDEEIPEQHYKAVAEVIGHVMRLARQRR